jgi:hypothetical protein
MSLVFFVRKVLMDMGGWWDHEHRPLGPMGQVGQ